VLQYLNGEGEGQGWDGSRSSSPLSYTFLSIAPHFTYFHHPYENPYVTALAAPPTGGGRPIRLKRLTTRGKPVGSGHSTLEPAGLDRETAAASKVGDRRRLEPARGDRVIHVMPTDCGWVNTMAKRSTYTVARMCTTRGVLLRDSQGRVVDDETFEARPGCPRQARGRASTVPFGIRQESPLLSVPHLRRPGRSRPESSREGGLTSR